MEASSSCSDPGTSVRKPVIVRVKRKNLQPLVETLLLEVSERPTKRLEAEFCSFSINESDSKDTSTGTTSKPSRLLFHHVETVTSCGHQEATRMNALLAELQNNKMKGKHRISIKQTNSGKHTTSRLKHQAFAQKARFEQLWRSRKGQKADAIAEAFHLYDIVRVDMDPEEIERHYRQELASRADEEEKQLLQRYLPLFKDYLPEIAAEMAPTSSESRVHADEYVYDLYVLHERIEEESANMSEYPMIQVVDEEELVWGFSSESEHDSEDSNGEDNPLNDYPEEEDDSELGLDSEEATESGSEVKSDASELENDDVEWDGLRCGSEDCDDDEDYF